MGLKKSNEETSHFSWLLLQLSGCGLVGICTLFFLEEMMVVTLNDDEIDVIKYALGVYGKCLEFNEQSDARNPWHEKHKRALSKVLVDLERKEVRNAG